MTRFKTYGLIIAVCISISATGQYRYNYLTLGIRELQEQDFMEAINYFTYHIKNYPNLYDAYYYRGIAKYNLDDLTGAEYDFTKAINCLPQAPFLYAARADVRSRNYKLKQANSDFNKAIELDSLYTEAYFFRALNFYNLRDYETALLDVAKVIELDSTYNKVYLLSGTLKSLLKEYADAILDFNKCLNRHPKNTFALVDRGAAYAKIDIIDLAMTDFETALAIDSLNPYAYFKRSLVKIDILDYEGALEDLNHVLELSPDTEVALFNRALIKSNFQAEGEALEDYINILNQNPDNMLVFFNMGISFARIGQYNDAIKSFNSAIDLYPDYADAYYQRALVKRELGEMEAAYADMQIFEQLKEKNLMKDDSTRYKEGLEILKLTHLSSEFLSKDEKKNRIQYDSIDFMLQPIYQTTLDRSLVNCFLIDKGLPESCIRFESIPLYSETRHKDSLYIRQQINALDTLIVMNEHNANYFLLRGLLQTCINNPYKAIEDLSRALSYEMNNWLIYFSRANARISILNEITRQKRWEQILPITSNIEELRIFSDIVYDLNKVLEFNPGFIYATYNLGYAKLLTEDYEGAYQDFSSVADERKVAEAHFNKALLQFFLKRKDEGCNELSIAGELGLKDAYPVIRRFCK